MRDVENQSPGPNDVVVPLTAPQKDFLDKQAQLEGKTPAQILIAAFLRTYNPRSNETG